MELKGLVELVQAGGPSAIAVLTTVLWWFERKRSEDERKRTNTMSDKLIELSATQIEASTKTAATLATVQQLLMQKLR